jgi:regulator of replication initiation timing
LTTELRTLIENERNNPQADQVRLQSLYSLKNILSTGDAFERLLTYVKNLEGTYSRANTFTGITIKRICEGLDTALKREDEMLALSDEFQTHIAMLEHLLEGRKLDNIIQNMASSRMDLEKIASQLVDGLTIAVRGISSAFNNFNVMTENVLDVLDADQVALIYQTYMQHFKSIDRIRQSATDALRKYKTSLLLKKIFGGIADFSFNFFNTLTVNLNDLIVEVEALQEFNNEFHPMQKVYEKALLEIENKTNEGRMSQCIQQFSDHFARAQEPYTKVSNSLDNLKRLFSGGNLQELHDGFDFMVMIREIFSVFGKILDMRVRNGYADPIVYRELDNVLDDKPDKLVDMAVKFRAVFS